MEKIPVKYENCNNKNVEMEVKTISEATIIMGEQHHQQQQQQQQQQKMVNVQLSLQ